MRALVYGTGMTGIAHALSLAEAGVCVTLAGASDSFAGGWSSDDISLGGKNFTLPRGIRLPVLSGTSLDRKFFSEEVNSEIEYYSYKTWTEEGCIVGEFSNKEISCIDLSGLQLTPQSLVDELKSVGRREVNCEQDRLEKTYGKTIVEQVFQPLAQPRFGSSLEFLPPSTMDGLIPKRFVLPETFYAAAGKSSSKVPTTIMAARTRTELETIPHLPVIYPVGVSLSAWVSRLKKTLSMNGVNVELNCPLENINLTGSQDRIDVRLNGEDLSFDLLLCAVPPISILKAITPTLADRVNIKPGDFRCFSIAHIECSGKTTSTNEFVNNFCPSSKSHRYKLWQNFKAHRIQENIITVELASLASDGMDVQTGAQHAIDELIAYGYLSKDSEITDIALLENIGKIPVFSIPQVNELNAVAQKLNQLHPKLSIVSSNSVKFLHQILCDADVFTKDIQKAA